MNSACPTCGRPVDDHDRHVRFRLPEPVAARPDLMDLPDFWTTDPDPSAAVMMVVPEMGGFVRALFPITMTEGHTLTYGVWVGVDSKTLTKAFKLWWSPKYSKLQISGRLANPIQPWGLVGSHVDLSVLNPDATPYCTSSTDPDCQLALTHLWEHDVPMRPL